MFKKTLAAAALMGVFGAASAASVTLYGVADLGLAYTHDKYTDVDGTVKTDEFRMDSGNNSGSRFGLKGTEELGNGLTVGFVLENGYKADTGALGTASTLFDREASLSLAGSFGKVYLGRMAGLISDTGSTGFYGSMASAFGSGWSSNISGHTAVMANYETRRDNTITYVSPEFAGATVYAQYAMGENTAENKPTTDRYAALGAEWKAGALDLGVLVDWTNKNSTISTADPTASVNDAWTFNLAGSYDCGFATTYLAVQYFKDASDVSSIADTFYSDDALETSYISADGFGVHLSTAFDVLGGTMKAGAGYMDGDAEYLGVERGDINAYTFSVGYEYALSKRTTLYTGAGYAKREFELVNNGGKLEDEAIDVVAGLVHRF